MKLAWKWTSILGLLAVAFIACSADGDHSQTTYRYYAFAIGSIYYSMDGSYLYSLSAFQVDEATGALTKVSDMPLDTTPTPHSLAAGPSGRFLYVASFGDPGHIRTLEIDAATGGLNEVAGSPFAAVVSPEMAFHPSGRFAYVSDGQYMGNHPGVSAYRVDPITGSLDEILGSRFDIASYSSIVVSPIGNAVYVAGYDEGSYLARLFAFNIDGHTGALTEMTGSPFAVREPPPTSLTIGTTLTDLSVDSSGKFLFGLTPGAWNMNSFLIDARTGTPTEADLSPFNVRSEPYGLVVEPSGRFVYVLTYSGISVYAIDEGTGALNAAAGLTPVDGWPVSIAVDPSGRFVYVSTSEKIGGLFLHSIRAFLINADTGALIEQAGSSLAVDYDIRDLIVIRTALPTQ